MNWRIGDILYAKDLSKVKGDGQLHLVGHIVELIPNEHGAMQHAMVRPKRGAKLIKVGFDWDKHIVALCPAARAKLPKEALEFLKKNPDLWPIRASLGYEHSIHFWSHGREQIVHYVITSEEAGELQFDTKDGGFSVKPEGTGNGGSFYAVPGKTGWHGMDIDLEDEPEIVY